MYRLERLNRKFIYELTMNGRRIMYTKGESVVPVAMCVYCRMLSADQELAIAFDARNVTHVALKTLTAKGIAEPPNELFPFFFCFSLSFCCGLGAGFFVPRIFVGLMHTKNVLALRMQIARESNEMTRAAKLLHPNKQFFRGVCCFSCDPRYKLLLFRMI